MNMPTVMNSSVTPLRSTTSGEETNSAHTACGLLHPLEHRRAERPRVISAAISTIAPFA